jgi:hypothetical protein
MGGQLYRNKELDTWFGISGTQEMEDDPVVKFFQKSYLQLGNWDQLTSS